MSQTSAPAKTMPVLDAAVTAGMCLTTLKALGRDAILVGKSGVVVGVASRAHLEATGKAPGGGNRPLRDASEKSGLVWL